MSHQTGIKPSMELAEMLAEAKSNNGNTRVLKVIIENEQLMFAEKGDVIASWEDDFDTLVQPLLEEKMPCYILYRTDTKNDMGYRWIFIPFIPDDSEIRQKMLYASTKATMKMSFGGSSHISEEYATTTKSEVTLNGYRKHLEIKAAPGPLTYAEEEAKMVQEMETRTDVGIDTRSQTLPGLAFRVQDDAMASIKEVLNYKNTYVQLSIDTENEVIQLECCEHIKVESLPSRVPEDRPRYHIFVYPHTYEGDVKNSHVFIYTMPGYKCPVKERMLYSSCKAPLLASLKQMGFDFEDLGAKDPDQLSIRSHIERGKGFLSTDGLFVDENQAGKRQLSFGCVYIEIGDGKELTADFLLSEIHPVRIIHKPKFSKPQGPAGRRGQSRVTNTDN